MKKVNVLIRILSFVVDYIIVSIPIIFIMMMYFHTSSNETELLFQLLLAVYGTLFMEYMDGCTIGKRIGKIKVVNQDNTKPTLVEYGMRELIKSIYIVPIFGWGLALISMVMMFLKDGLTIHDYIAKTKVKYIWDQVEDEEK